MITWCYFMRNNQVIWPVCWNCARPKSMNIHYTDMHIHWNKCISLSLDMHIYCTDREINVYTWQINRHAFISTYIDVCIYEYLLFNIHSFNKPANIMWFVQVDLRFSKLSVHQPLNEVLKFSVHQPVNEVSKFLVHHPLKEVKIFRPLIP